MKLPNHQVRSQVTCLKKMCDFSDEMQHSGHQGQFIGNDVSLIIGFGGTT
jgi:hypothetical protein